MEAVLSCIKLGAQVWRARPVVLFSSSLQEVFLILSSFILLSRNGLSLLLIFLYSGTYLLNRCFHEDI
jgi:hypothetical protein